MEFKKVKKISRFLDPMTGFNPAERFSEVRYDPLTGHTARILDFPIKETIRQDLVDIIELSKKICPFCPELIELVTPRFSPSILKKEKYRCGQAVCFPNAFPYDENSAVTVMTPIHYIKLSEFTVNVLTESLKCSLLYLSDLYRNQKRCVFQSINWNYMPLAGGSIIHPHLQVYASDTPTNYYKDIIDGLNAYKCSFKKDFWDDFIEYEKKADERFISEDESISWVTAFAPMGIFDVIGIIKNCRRPADIDDKTLQSIASGILNVLRFIDSLNMESLNMSIYFRAGDASFLPHIRICPRIVLPPFNTSQINYMKMLHNESLTTILPEEICSAMKDIWNNNIL